MVKTSDIFAVIFGLMVAAEVLVPLAQFLFKGSQPSFLPLKQGECASPKVHIIGNLTTVFANIMGPEAMKRELYSSKFLQGKDQAILDIYRMREQRYNVSSYVRTTQEMPAITSECYPTMITGLFAMVSTEIREAFDGRMVNHADYLADMKEYLPDKNEQQAIQLVDSIYLNYTLDSRFTAK